MTKHQKIQDGAVDLSRRSFLVSAGAAGLVCGFGALPGASPALAAAPYDPSIWYSIAPDGIVTVNVGKADMGQHIASTMAQIVAEELGASWSHMRVNLVGNDPKYGDPVLGAIITGGSWSTMMNFDAMSRAGAAGRMALVEAGAGMLGASAGECVAGDSRVSHPKSGKSVSYADIVKSGKATKAFSADEMKAIKLKTADQYTMIGKDLPQLDIPLKVNGTAKFGIDTMLPGMVYGRVVTPPVRYGAKVTAVDDSAAKKVAGFIQAVVLDDKTGTTTGWVVAVAKTYGEAIKAAEALKVTYDNGPNASVSSESILAEAKRLQALPEGGELYVKEGDAAEALGKAAKVIEAEYTTNINIHCPMEPMNATAEFKDGILHLYSGNQFMTRSTAIAAGAVGIDPKNVVIHQAWIGGGFGRRLELRHDDPRRARRPSGRQAGQGHLFPRERHDDGFLASAHLPEDARGARRQGKHCRDRPRPGQRLADQAVGHSRLLDAVGRQEGRAGRFRRPWRGLLLQRAQPHDPHDPQRVGAKRHPVGPIALGRAGLDVLGGGKPH